MLYINKQIPKFVSVWNTFCVWYQHLKVSCKWIIWLAVYVSLLAYTLWGRFRFNIFLVKVSNKTSTDLNWMLDLLPWLMEEQWTRWFKDRKKKVIFFTKSDQEYFFRHQFERKVIQVMSKAAFAIIQYPYYLLRHFLLYYLAHRNKNLFILIENPPLIHKLYLPQLDQRYRRRRSLQKLWFSCRRNLSVGTFVNEVHNYLMIIGS